MLVIDKAAFFKDIRKSVFRGKLTQSQVDGMSKVLDYRALHWPNMIDEELAYVLATIWKEVGAAMQPIKEGGGEAYLRSKYYWPYYGRGLSQITHKRNYARWKIDQDPDKALDWDLSLKIIFDDMIYGRFTGKKLSDYISADRTDYRNARKVVNGLDAANEIARIAEQFLDALKGARREGDAISTENAKAGQARLKALDYQLGAIDGIVGEATVGAIAMFQYTNHLPITGRFDVATVDVLMSERAIPSAVAERRESATVEDIKGSRTVEGARQGQAAVWQLLGSFLVYVFAPGNETMRLGARGLAVVAGAWFVWRAIDAAKQVTAARLSDYRNGANLGR